MGRVARSLIEEILSLLDSTPERLEELLTRHARGTLAEARTAELVRELGELAARARSRAPRPDAEQLKLAIGALLATSGLVSPRRELALQGRALYLTADTELIRRQLDGLDLE